METYNWSDWKVFGYVVELRLKYEDQPPTTFSRSKPHSEFYQAENCKKCWESDLANWKSDVKYSFEIIIFPVYWHYKNTNNQQRQEYCVEYKSVRNGVLRIERPFHNIRFLTLWERMLLRLGFKP